MLALLSAGPRSFNTLIPSKDHKPVYFEVLAWLLRGGWVTQLRTFGWVRVPPAIQASVAREEAEGLQDSRLKLMDGEDSHKAEGEDNDDPGEPDMSSGALSPHYRSGLSSPSSLSSARTAIPLHMHASGELPERSGEDNKGGKEIKEGLPASKNLASSLHQDKGAAPSLHSDKAVAVVESFQPRLILQPTKASGVESRYLAHIARALEAAEGTEVRECWEKCVKYFNGEHALEKIAVREGWKRKRVEALRAGWTKTGVLVEVRHW